MNEIRPSILPVTVITGFLGSGKTTLLNRIIHHPKVGQVAVIVNEFGEVGLDNLLIESSSEDLILLGSGCVCCTVRTDLVETLLSLFARRNNGETPAFNRVVLETSGLADPAPILHTLMTDPDVIQCFYLDGIVTTVDVLDGEGQLDQYPEAEKQAALADRLVLTKTDLAEEADIQLVRERISQINPAARILEATVGDLDPDEVLNVGLYDTNRQRPDIRRWLHTDAYGTEHAIQAHSHTTSVDSYCIYNREPISRAALGMWLNQLTQDYGANLLRIKGIVNVSGLSGPMAVNGVQHRLYPPAVLDHWPFDDHQTRVVFIVRGLDQKTVEKSLSTLSARFQPVSVGLAQ
ncbi:MAG: GTP-binding protein [Gammaproteobacteria bacterium]|nr:GTP-binding protein [Gammaproteobacteria bacterium]